ncbi:MAG: carbohydrate kinase [Lachnospiraceae bacterium]|nr:carbohydrate kinase [Lachnospiraceae bacterium]
MKIICAGEMLIDFTPLGESFSYKANPGGAVANVAVSTARNGIDTSFLGLLGNDDFGRMLKGILEKERITMLTPDLTDAAVTTLAFVTLYDNGERSFTFVRKPGADILLHPDDVKESDIKACDLLHAGSVSLSDSPSREAIGKAVKCAHNAGKMVSFDVNYRDNIWHDEEKCKACVYDLLPYVDFLKISDEETFIVGGSVDNIPDFMTKNHLRVLIETLGADGARYFVNDNGTIRSDVISGYSVKAIDATGAGDAFWGGFLSRILMFEPTAASSVTEEMVRTALVYGNKSGALCVQKPGGIPAIPGKAAIETFEG